MNPFISGILLGGVLSLMVGPVFFMIINMSIKKGFFPASMLALGVFCSDLMYVVMTYYGSSMITIMKEHNHIVGLSGGILILLFGVFTFFKEAKVDAGALELVDDSKTRAIDMLKGFMMNTLNPSALLFWLGVAGTISVKEDFVGSQAVLFYSGVLGMVLSTDLLKAWLATLLRKMISGRFLLWMNRISGIALTSFGIYMIVRLYTFH
ncbi:MAG TPA: LysE family translocator [Bacteroidia bacterium]|nr:LysE family translocator [Bacteroidia bacterium]